MPTRIRSEWTGAAGSDRPGAASPADGTADAPGEPAIASLDVEVSADRTLARLVVNGAAGPVALDAAALSAAIDRLGAARMRMLPPVAAARPRTALVDVITDPRWASASDVMGGASLLRIRDPRFGWIGYAFPPLVAARLGTILLTQARKASSALNPRRTN